MCGDGEFRPQRMECSREFRAGLEFVELNTARGPGLQGPVLEGFLLPRPSAQPVLGCEERTLCQAVISMTVRACWQFAPCAEPSPRSVLMTGAEHRFPVQRWGTLRLPFAIVVVILPKEHGSERGA
jgi:hypothetical protein